jgi:hypothetical protein
MVAVLRTVQSQLACNDTRLEKLEQACCVHHWADSLHIIVVA